MTWHPPDDWFYSLRESERKRVYCSLSGDERWELDRTESGIILYRCKCCHRSVPARGDPPVTCYPLLMDELGGPPGQFYRRVFMEEIKRLKRAMPEGLERSRAAEQEAAMIAAKMTLDKYREHLLGSEDNAPE